MAELLFEELSLADVPRVQDDPTDVGVEREIRPHALHMDPPSVAMPPSELHELRRPILLTPDLREEGDDPRDVVGMDQVLDQPGAHELLRRRSAGRRRDGSGTRSA